MKRASNLNGLRAFLIFPKTHKSTRLGVHFSILGIQFASKGIFSVLIQALDILIKRIEKGYSMSGKSEASQGFCGS